MSEIIDGRGLEEGALTYEELVSNVEIKNINVKRLNMEGFIQPYEVRNYLGKDKNISINIKHEFKLESNKSDSNVFFAIGLIQASASIEKDIMFLVDLELLAEYDASAIDGPIHEDLFERFVDQNVPLNLWPYAREIIQTGTARMGYPPLVIRPYRVLV